MNGEFYGHKLKGEPGFFEVGSIAFGIQTRKSTAQPFSQFQHYDKELSISRMFIAYVIPFITLNVMYPNSSYSDTSAVRRQHAV